MDADKIKRLERLSAVAYETSESGWREEDEERAKTALMREVVRDAAQVEGGWVLPDGTVADADAAVEAWLADAERDKSILSAEAMGQLEPAGSRAARRERHARLRALDAIAGRLADAWGEYNFGLVVELRRELEAAARGPAGYLAPNGDELDNAAEVVEAWVFEAVKDWAQEAVEAWRAELAKAPARPHRGQLAALVARAKADNFVTVPF